MSSIFDLSTQIKFRDESFIKQSTMQLVIYFLMIYFQFISFRLGKTQEKLLTVPSSDSPTTNPTEILLYETTPETVNLFRIARLILDLCNDAMRDLMQSKVPGGELGLTKKIACSKTYLASSRLSKDQERLLFPPNNAQVQYQSLDFTLMYALVRNVFHEKLNQTITKKIINGVKDQL